jgi:hypothetical protein
MAQPTTLHITVTREPTTDLCICAQTSVFKNPADHRIETQLLDEQGQKLDGAEGVEYRCGYGADLVIEQAKVVGRVMGLETVVEADRDTEVDRDLVTHLVKTDVTVQELINRLQTVQNKDLPVILSVNPDDPTTYPLEGDLTDVYVSGTIMGTCLVIQGQQ